ncbi:hypothetical protein [Vibrio coralliilyticus]|uniref:hypothetical protein n=1 Tax=Vibrio coralliilyticus TaxID=190893 RepID=UPI0017E08DC0|nr:hypothetical protein [Vibrio coralliilyticus]NUW68086.1 hypothetical protein [Vibrio coralliilyticus]
MRSGNVLPGSFMPTSKIKKEIKELNKTITGLDPNDIKSVTNAKEKTLDLWGVVSKKLKSHLDDSGKENYLVSLKQFTDQFHKKYQMPPDAGACIGHDIFDGERTGGNVVKSELSKSEKKTHHEKVSKLIPHVIDLYVLKSSIENTAKTAEKRKEENSNGSSETSTSEAIYEDGFSVRAHSEENLETGTRGPIYAKPNKKKKDPDASNEPNHPNVDGEEQKDGNQIQYADLAEIKKGPKKGPKPEITPSNYAQILNPSDYHPRVKIVEYMGQMTDDSIYVLPSSDQPELYIVEIVGEPTILFEAPSKQISLKNALDYASEQAHSRYPDENIYSN